MNFNKLKHNNNAFTMIELMVVTGIIAILVLIVFIAINPSRSLKQTRDSRRGQDINQILTGINECIVDDKYTSITNCIGNFNHNETYELVYEGFNTGCDNICKNVNSDTHCLPVDKTLEHYFFELPHDPRGVQTGHTNYTITVNENNLILIEACAAEIKPINVSR